MVRQVHPPSAGMQKGLMAGVLLLLGLVMLTPIGSGGLRSRPAHAADLRPSHRWGTACAINLKSKLDEPSSHRTSGTEA